jgi:Down syndrome cell adhesion protein 1
VLPQIVPFDFGADEVNLDEMVSAMCTVNKGDFPIDIQWIHADLKGVERKLVTSDGIVITRTNQRISMLSIESCQRRHIGNFSCVASNRAGMSSHSAFLSINGSGF